MIKYGITRIVILVGNYAIKIPNFTYSHQHFLNGCIANWSERVYTKMYKNADCDFYSKIAPTIFCIWFGLISIQKRVILLDRSLTEAECIYFKDQTSDIKGTNFGYLNEKIVCIDYA